ncbi:16S rRNA (adenine(1518)-N(6)/adenine(1519)-N(6))-dimethyltransferase RsmA [Candidatus Pelagibacter sp.]|nr:16S rRNA (adenine(1518)-N(6)/adenine(1519)-N(6))-dimethyltransferase RsmA [Candidatus Pelagibacter sp.]
MIKAKKSLGQNFLIDQNIIDKIINTVEIKDKSILEIGPGTGNLTKNILKKKPKKLIVVEKDDNLAEILIKNFNSNVEIIKNDILKLDESNLNESILTVFGNLPYNISTEILCKWILNIKNKNFWFDNLVLMFQKEVADRIIAKFNTKNYGRLSILSNWKLEIEKICDVQPSSFFPRPKIDSSVLLLKPKLDFFPLTNPKNLEKLTRIFFMHRRKMLKKSYNLLFNGNLDIANKLNIDLSLRPQNLNFETYYKLSEEYESLRS